MAGQGAQLLPAGHVPHLERVVPRCGDGQPAIRRERHGADLAGMAGQGAQLPPARHVPHLERAVARGGDGQPAIRRERHGSDRVGMAGQGAHQRTARRVQGLAPDGRSQGRCVSRRACASSAWIGSSSKPSSRPVSCEGNCAGSGPTTWAERRSASWIRGSTCSPLPAGEGSRSEVRSITS